MANTVVQRVYLDLITNLIKVESSNNDTGGTIKGEIHFSELNYYLNRMVLDMGYTDAAINPTLDSATRIIEFNLQPPPP